MIRNCRIDKSLPVVNGRCLHGTPGCTEHAERARWIQADQMTIAITCKKCGNLLEAIDVETCASADKGPHPHVACLTCAPKAGACVMLAVQAEGAG